MNIVGKLLVLILLSACAERFVTVKKISTSSFKTLNNESLSNLIEVSVRLMEPRQVYAKALGGNASFLEKSPPSSSSNFQKQSDLKLPWPYLSVFQFDIHNLSKDKTLELNPTQLTFRFSNTNFLPYTSSQFYSCFPSTRFESERLYFLFDRQANYLTMKSNDLNVLKPKDFWSFYVVFDGLPLALQKGEIAVPFQLLGTNQESSSFILTSSIQLSNERIKKVAIRSLF